MIVLVFAGYVPPDARSQELHKDFVPMKGISCQEIQIAEERGVQLHGILVQRALGYKSEQQPKVLVVYFQGEYLVPQ